MMASKHKSFFKLQVNFDLGTASNAEITVTIVKNRCTAQQTKFLRLTAVFFNILRPYKNRFFNKYIMSETPELARNSVLLRGLSIIKLYAI